MFQGLIYIIILLTLVSQTGLADTSSDAASGVFRHINGYRSKQGLGSLQQNSNLQQAARNFAVFMAKSGKYSHDADGRSAGERALAAGYQHCIIKENIGRCFRSSGYSAIDLAKKLSESWWNSPGHRQNLLDGDIKETGIGIAQSKSGRYFGVQLFGRLKSTANVFRVKNELKESLHYTLDEKHYTITPRQTRTHTRCRQVKLTCPCGNPGDPKILRPENGAFYRLRRTRNAIVIVNAPES